MIEDFSPPKVGEHKGANNLHAEWLEESKQPGHGKLEAQMAAGNGGKDQPQGPGKDVADRLDRELKAFANTKQGDNPSDGMKAFQQLVNKFEDASNKKEAINEFGPAARLRSLSWTTARSAEAGLSCTASANTALHHKN